MWCNTNSTIINFNSDIMSEYSITEISNFAETIRDSAASNLSSGEYNSKIIHTFITLNQVIDIIKKESLGLDSDGLFVINEEIFDNIFEQVSSIIYQSALCKVASQDLIQCAWDDEENKMVFWVGSNSEKIIDSNPF